MFSIGFPFLLPFTLPWHVEIQKASLAAMYPKCKSPAIFGRPGKDARPPFTHKLEGNDNKNLSVDMCV